MPKEIKDLKEFIKIMRREKKHLPKAEKITIKKNKKNSVTKFKLRTPKFLYTLMVNDVTRADKIMQSIPPNLRLAMGFAPCGARQVVLQLWAMAPSGDSEFTFITLSILR